MASIPQADDSEARIRLATELLDGTRPVTAATAPDFLLQFGELALDSLFAKEAVEDAAGLIQRISIRLETAPLDIAALMAAMLLQPAYKWPHHGSMRDVPTWLIDAYASWRILSPRAFEQIGQVKAYAAYLRATLDECGQVYTERALGSEGTVALGNAVYNKWNFIQLYFTDSPNLDAILAKSHFVERHLARNNMALSWIFSDRKPGAKIRVGIYSSQQNISPEACFLASHLETFPHDRCELILFFHNDIPNDFQKFCFSLFDKVVLLQGGLNENVATIREHDLDIMAFANNATTLSNHVTLFCSSRLARTQIILAASPMSTGYTASDVFLSAALNEMPGPISDSYSEEVYTLPGMLNYFAFHHDHDPQTMVFTRQSLGVPEGAILFMSLANYYKSIPELVESWARILHAVPNSVLLVLPFGTAWGYYDLRPFVNNFSARFREQGIATDRLLLQSPVPTRADVLALVSLADVYLDSYPFSGSCSLLDPLLARAPLVAREGPTFRSRFAATMLRFAGLGDLVTDSSDAYEAAAIRLAKSAAERAEIRRRIDATFAQGVPYFDVETLPKRVEQAFVDLSHGYEARIRALRDMPPAILKQHIAELSSRLHKQRNHFWEELNRVELIRLLAMSLGRIAMPQALEFDMPHAVSAALRQQKWIITPLAQFSGQGSIDLIYMRLPQGESFALSTLGAVRPGLVIVEIGPVNGAESYRAQMAGSAGANYDFLIVTYATDLRVPFHDIDNRPLGIHFDIPDTQADFALIVFFQAGATDLLAQLLATLDRFQSGRDRSWMRLVPEGHREKVLAEEVA